MPANEMETNVVHIVDDDLDMRESIACVLNTVGYSVAAYSTADEFLLSVESNGHGGSANSCLLIDLLLPGMSGLRLLREIRSRKQSCAVVVISGNGDVPSAVEAMQLGAVDFLEKPFTRGRLLGAVNEALRKARELQERSEAEKAVSARLAKLTDREREIFRALADGLLTKEIAKRFAISTRTVDVHRSRIMQKLGIASPLQLAHLIATLTIGENRSVLAH
jgi:RNA polymerase sigma factor (sigma-70 family)